MGNYAILGWRKTVSFEGFAYYEYKLSRKYCNKIARLPPKLADMIDVETTAKNIDEMIPAPAAQAAAPVLEILPVVSVPLVEPPPSYHFFPRCS